jgi:hypothetical protein
VRPGGHGRSNNVFFSTCVERKLRPWLAQQISSGHGDMQPIIGLPSKPTALRAFTSPSSASPVRNTAGVEHDDSTPRSLAIQMVLASCRAHQKEIVISPPLASYLLRNESRFLFSHHAVWCPVFESILLGGKAFTTLKHADKEPIFVSAAMHYLCQPQELFHENVFDFYSQYEIIDFTGKMKRGKEIFEFTNGEFTHPLYSSKTITMLQCIVKRKTKALICVPQYTFPDTASFNGSILDQNTKSNEEMDHCMLKWYSSSLAN